MKLINSKVEILEPTGYTIDDIYKQIEIAGRTCYKSEDKITPTSAKEFVDRMIKSGHGAMLEHGTVYLEFHVKDPSVVGEEEYHNQQAILNKLINKYSTNKYSVVKVNHYYDTAFITTNYRVLVENGWLEDLKYICEPTVFHEKRISVRWTCDRVTGESFLRHRVFSFAREATGYCNYSKDKFGNELTFIIPTWCNDLQDGVTFEDRLDVDKFVWGDINYEDINNIKVDEYTRTFLYSNIDSELNYIHLINKGYKPKQARQVLPFCIKSPLIMTGFESDWKHFFELRCDTAAHPDARKLALELYNKLYNKEYGKE